MLVAVVAAIVVVGVVVVASWGLSLLAFHERGGKKPDQPS